MKATRIAIVMGLTLWLATIALYLWPQSPPFESFGTDTVTPDRAKVGESFVVSRNYRATRREVWAITRTMVRGDCRKSCEFVELPAGALLVGEGTYVDVRRSYVVPANVTPGVWTLLFTVQWDAAFWGTQKMPLPPLTITIDP